MRMGEELPWSRLRASYLMTTSSPYWTPWRASSVIERGITPSPPGGEVLMAAAATVMSASAMPIALAKMNPWSSTSWTRTFGFGSVGGGGCWVGGGGVARGG